MMLLWLFLACLCTVMFIFSCGKVVLISIFSAKGWPKMTMPVWVIVSTLFLAASIYCFYLFYGTIKLPL